MPAIHSTSRAVARCLVASLFAITSALAQVSATDLSVTVKGTRPAQSSRVALGVSNDAFGTVAAPSFAKAAADPWLADFQRAVATQPWVLGYRIPAGDFAGASAQVSGRFPPAVQGVQFRNGPATHDMGGLRYQHWFVGDGMVQRCTRRWPHSTSRA